MIVNAGRPDKLRYNTSLCAVDYKGACVGHKRKIAHINSVFLNLSGLFVLKARSNL